MSSFIYSNILQPVCKQSCSAGIRMWPFVIHKNTRYLSCKKVLPQTQKNISFVRSNTSLPNAIYPLHSVINRSFVSWTKSICIFDSPVHLKDKKHSLKRLSAYESVKCYRGISSTPQQGLPVDYKVESNKSITTVNLVQYRSRY